MLWTLDRWRVLGHGLAGTIDSLYWPFYLLPTSAYQHLLPHGPTTISCLGQRSNQWGSGCCLVLDLNFWTLRGTNPVTLQRYLSYFTAVAKVASVAFSYFSSLKCHFTCWEARHGLVSGNLGHSTASNGNVAHHSKFPGQEKPWQISSWLPLPIITLWP